MAKEIIETKPEINILSEKHEKVPVGINNELQELSVKLLKEYDDYRTHNYDRSFPVKAKGFCINGFNKGKTIDIWLKGKAAATGKTAAGAQGPSVTVVIADIKQRTKRSAELDAEKVYARILTDFEKHPTQKNIDEKVKAIPPVEDVAMLMMVLNYDFNSKRAIEQRFKLSSSPEKLYQQLQDLSYGEITWMIRRAFFSKHRGNYPKSDEAYIIRKMAESFKDIPIAQYEKEQKEIKDRREARAADRIAALQPVKKSAKPIKAVDSKAKKDFNKAMNKAAAKSKPKKKAA